MTDQLDPVMAMIAEAVALGHAGEREDARRRFAEIWSSLGSTGDPLHRCAAAHYAADVQDELSEELCWDLRALKAADQVTDGQAREFHHSLAVEGFYPSLHLNLADVYRRLGELETAEMHLDKAQNAVGSLADDGYGQMIRDGIARCAARIGVEVGTHGAKGAAGQAGLEVHARSSSS